MDVSNLYVPDSKKWIEFYKTNYVHDQRKVGQFGGSIVGGIKSSIQPIERPARNKEAQKDVPVKIMSPAQAVVEQAEMEIKRQFKGMKRRQKCETTSKDDKRRRVKTKDYLS